MVRCRRGPFGFAMHRSCSRRPGVRGAPAADALAEVTAACSPAPVARVRVKICGVTTPEDARMAAAAGADAVGVNFHPPSPRALTPAAARAVVAALPPLVQAVGVFVNPKREWVTAVLDAVPLGSLQFHGDESAAFCRSFGLPYIKAAPVGPGFRFADLSARHPDAKALLLDAWDAVRPGGTGRTFDWGRWPRTDRPLILAGGLRPDNVAAAIAATRPYAVDVASGVEGAVVGRKAPAKVARFMAAVRGA